MQVSAREAAEMLSDVGLTRPQAQRILEAGLAGPAERTRGAHLYDGARVAALRDAPDVVLPPGIGPTLIARVGAARRLRADLSVEQLGRAVAGPWRATALQRLEVRLAALEAAAGSGPVPFLATVSGYVAFAAEVTGVEVTGHPDVGQTFFVLGEPGPWARDAVGARCPTGPGASWLWIR